MTPISTTESTSQSTSKFNLYLQIPPNPNLPQIIETPSSSSGTPSSHSETPSSEARENHRTVIRIGLIKQSSHEGTPRNTKSEKPKKLGNNFRSSVDLHHEKRMSLDVVLALGQKKTKKIEAKELTQKKDRSPLQKTNRYAEGQITRMNNSLHFKNAERKLEPLLVKQKEAHLSFYLTIKNGRQIDPILNELKEDYENELKKKCFKDENKEDYKTEMEQQFKDLVLRTHNSKAYKNYAGCLALIDELKTKNIPHKSIAEKIEIWSKKLSDTDESEYEQIEILLRNKESCLEYLILQAEDEWNIIQTHFTKENRQLSKELENYRCRFLLLRRIAKKTEAPEVLKDCFLRMLKSSGVTIQHTILAPLETPDTNQDNHLQFAITAITTLLSLLESEVLCLQERQDTINHELLRCRKLLTELVKHLQKGSTNPQKSPLVINKDSEEITLRKSLKSRTRTSSNSVDVLSGILKSCGKILLTSKSSKLILEIFDLMDKAEWVKSALNRSPDLLARKKQISKRIEEFNNISVTVKKTDGRHLLWEFLLDAPVDTDLQKKFLLVYKHIIHSLVPGEGSAEEKLFELFFMKFQTANPFARKQLLNLATYWLNEPMVHSMDSKKFANEIKLITPNLNSLIRLAEVTQCWALSPYIKNIKNEMAKKAALINMKHEAVTKIHFETLPSPITIIKLIKSKQEYKEFEIRFARNLTQTFLHEFLQVDTSELLATPFKHEGAPHMHALIEWSTNLSFWVKQILSTCEDPREFNLLLTFFTRTIDKLLDSNKNLAHPDFLSTFSIYFSIQAAVSYIPNTSPAKKTIHIPNHLVELFSSPGMNFPNIRNKINELPLFIPPLMLIAKALDPLLDKGINPLLNNGGINLEALMHIANVIKPISELQKKATLFPHEICYSFKQDFERIRDNKAYKDGKTGLFDEYEFDNVFTENIRNVFKDKTQDVQPKQLTDKEIS